MPALWSFFFYFPFKDASLISTNKQATPITL